jgi:hypothetical protein
MRGAETDSDHFLVRAKIILKIKRTAKTKKSERKQWDIGEGNKREIKGEFIKEVTANVQNTQLEEMEDMNEIWNKIKKGINVNEAPGKIIGKEERPQRNIRFEEECQMILQEKKAQTTKLLTEIPNKKQECKDKRTNVV